jgi:hypothetical protein
MCNLIMFTNPRLHWWQHIACNLGRKGKRGSGRKT